MSAVSLLVILDGFGYREDSTDNAIAQANTPVSYTHLTLPTKA